MLKLAEVENFQLIRSLRLKLEAVTALVGESERGKSCFFRAIEAAINNPRGSKFIRKGFSSCRVYVETDRGSVEWVKQREGSASYKVVKDGATEVFNKVEECPGLVKEVLGIKECQFGDDVFKVVNLAGQFEPPFLIFDTGSKVAKVAGKFTRLDEIYAAVRVANKDLQSLRHDEQTARKSLEAAKDKMERHAGIEKLEPVLASLETKASGLDSAKDNLESLVVGLERAKKVFKNIEALEVEAGVADQLVGWPVPTIKANIAEIERLEKECTTVRRLANNLRVAETQAIRAQAKLKVAQEERDKFKEENKLCPACGKAW